MSNMAASMSPLIGNHSELGWTAAKALLLFAVAVVGLRLSERRVVAQLNVFDFVVTVAVGAIVGRTATSSTESFATGAVALITLLLAHRLRGRNASTRLVGHSSWIVVRWC